MLLPLNTSALGNLSLVTAALYKRPSRPFTSIFTPSIFTSPVGGLLVSLKKLINNSPSPARPYIFVSGIALNTSYQRAPVDEGSSSKSYVVFNKLLKVFLFTWSPVSASPNFLALFPLSFIPIRTINSWYISVVFSKFKAFRSAKRFLITLRTSIPSGRPNASLGLISLLK